ncbi:MAG TPA: ABC transporter permease subunit [Candidatus Methylacidiphilales bacterium]|jgi:ABC-type dipeptide/oligopeptide/nickel transport system permease component|nr:ABC transporter permease subunit [Candidatus Methylacidiphilales bacterium]
MTAFILRRLRQAIVVLFVVLSLTFLLCRSAPGNPFANGKSIRPEIMAQIEKQYDLHGPIYIQYGQYLNKVVRGNLGISTQYLNRSVNEIIAQALPVSMTLGALAYLLALVFGIILGAWAAVRHNQWGDRALMLVALLGISIPTFVSAPLLVLWLALTWRLLPAYGWGSIDQIILPAFCLSLPFTAAIARLTRGSLLEVLKLDFVRTARAKGLPESAVLFRHALKVAILPIIGYSGPAAAGILTGSLVVETLFGIPGIGQFFVNSALNHDPFMTSGVVLVFSLFLILFNLLADILYFVVDRRVKLE